MKTVCEQERERGSPYKNYLWAIESERGEVLIQSPY